ncbi:MAG: hypothetical protein JWQ66_3075 [Mucilaginibacter sp.]|nr:hypothetical protein [Mucilaginibacter sp.]
MIPNKQYNPIKFALWFIGLFICFYYFNILFFGITSPGNHYSSFLANHLNYIQGLRRVLLSCTAAILKSFGYGVITNDTELLVAGHGVIQVVYSCLGLGVISFFISFVLAYPKPRKAKFIFIVSGILAIEFLNVLRFVILALFWSKQKVISVDHHTIFNIFIYIIIIVSLYYWVRNDVGENKQHAKN